ncbi:MAG: hypothetical protein AAGA48_20455 [Myxococcota bacterium]
MSVSRWLLVLIGLGVLGTLGLWVFSPREMPSNPNLAPVGDDVRRERAQVASKPERVDQMVTRLNRARDLESALSIRSREIEGCFELARLHDGTTFGESIELVASYTPTDEGLWTAQVTAPELSAVTFDRCLNNLIEPILLNEDRPATLVLAPSQ